MTTKIPLELAASILLTGSYSGPTDPNQETGNPTKNAKEAPVMKSLEEYSTRSPEAQEKGKEEERDWYSLIGCCSGGTGQSVSGRDGGGWGSEFSAPNLRREGGECKGSLGNKLWWRNRRWWRDGGLREDEIGVKWRSTVAAAIAAFVFLFLRKKIIFQFQVYASLLYYIELSEFNNKKIKKCGQIIVAESYHATHSKFVNNVLSVRLRRFT